jgi:hypothetical protein
MIRCGPISLSLVGETVNIVFPLESTDVLMLTKGDESDVKEIERNEPGSGSNTDGNYWDWMLLIETFILLIAPFHTGGLLKT